MAGKLLSVNPFIFRKVYCSDKLENNSINIGHNYKGYEYCCIDNGQFLTVLVGRKKWKKIIAVPS